MILAKELQAKINAMQGLGKRSGTFQKTGLEIFASAFPDGIFPAAAIHEFVSYEPSHAASTIGFISALTSKFMPVDGLCLWIGSQSVFASGLKHFGLEPDRIIFINPKKIKDTLWIMEEALKCEVLSAVIVEIKELGFAESRRLQLVVERSGVNCFIHRFCPYAENNTACTTRWKITSLPSHVIEDLPGIGHNCWDVQLVKVRNGKPNSWQIEWHTGHFQSFSHKQFSIPTTQERYTG